MTLSRRNFLTAATAFTAVPKTGFASTPLEITWDDLMPPGIAYSQIIGEGEMDEAADTWRPIFDENATKLNPKLDGALIKMPGYIVPLEFTVAGVTSFVLVPYVGACIHTPPPPPNQLVLVSTSKAWPNDKLWDAVWVEGKMQNQIQSTDIADTGYFIDADKIEVYTW